MKAQACLPCWHRQA